MDVLHLKTAEKRYKQNLFTPYEQYSSFEMLDVAFVAFQLSIAVEADIALL